MSIEQIASGVGWMRISIANIYFVGDFGSEWVLVDSGTPSHADSIRKAAEDRYGPGARPRAILLTHGHFDHAGCAGELAQIWDVPVYAHPLERPYLTGRSSYPPGDPTVGGAMAFLSRFFPVSPIDIGSRLRDLPADGETPGLPDWKWYHTPGHAPGQVSFFREKGAVLLAGDALATADVDSWIGLTLQQQRVSRPPAPFTYDWTQAANSVELLASLRPAAIACGHGVPMTGPGISDELVRLVWDFPTPAHGRYVPEPARADETGVTYVPPPVADPLPSKAALFGAAAVTGMALTWKVRRAR